MFKTLSNFKNSCKTSGRTFACQNGTYHFQVKSNCNKCIRTRVFRSWINGSSGTLPGQFQKQDLPQGILELIFGRYLGQLLGLRKEPYCVSLVISCLQIRVSPSPPNFSGSLAVLRSRARASTEPRTGL